MFHFWQAKLREFCFIQGQFFLGEGQTPHASVCSPPALKRNELYFLVDYAKKSNPPHPLEPIFCKNNGKSPILS